MFSDAVVECEVISSEIKTMTYERENEL